LNAKTATVFENASKARISKNLRRGGSLPRYTESQSFERVAKPPVLRLAGGAKLRPADVGFSKTHYKLTNCNSIAEGNENEDEYSVKPNSGLKD
jgi:hypothetical protein